jgi:predicted phage terminase large subunit-like protein
LVQAVRVSGADSLLEIEAGSGRVVRLTGGHRVWSDGYYAAAETLGVGDGVLGVDGWKAREKRIRSIRRLSGEAAVYDLTVAGNENFFAGGLLVHNCLIIDDPIKNHEDAESLTRRDGLWDWYTSTLYTRLYSGGGIILIQTRWHMDDLAGRVLELSGRAGNKEKWRVLSFPALAETDEEHRREGDPLHPAMYCKEDLLRIKATIGSRDWAALYQQRPVPEGGQVFKREWLRHWDALPESFDVVLSSWDMSFKDNKNSDFVVGQIWGKKGADYYLLDQVRARLDFTQTMIAFMDMSRKWPEALEKLIEDRANGPAVINALQNRIDGIIGINPEGGKLARAYAVTPLFEAGNVYLPSPKKAVWTVDLENEFLSFPAGAHDDQVDAATQALNRLSTKKRVMTEVYTMGERAEILPAYMRSMLS